MRVRRTLSVLAAGVALLLLTGTPVDGDDLKARSLRTPEQNGAKDERLATVSMWSLHWHDDWKDAVLLNRIERRKPVLIFHLRILGDLAAKT